MHVPSNKTDHLALLKFKQAIESDPESVLSSWNDSVNLCNWVGITSSLRHQRVTALDLPQRNLHGFISPYMANLTFLSLVMNCSNLEIIDISRNKLTGKLPKEIGFLVKLVRIYAGGNNLTGDIPPTIGNLSSLETFRVSFNNLVGHIPDDVGHLKRLLFFHIAANGLSGTIPTSLYNISSMTEISMAYNHQLRGTLPDNIGIILPNLQAFGLASNQFSGSIPASLCNASKLQIISINYNNFVGQVPTNFGNLQELWWLGVGSNNLGRNSSNDLDFIRSSRNCSKLKILAFNHNHLEGVLPNSMANLSTQLNLLLLASNQVSGNVDGAVFENLINLIEFAMEDNLFTGIIPTLFAIPHQVLGLYSLSQMLNLSKNSLNGTLPAEVGDLKNLNAMDLSENNFSGKIPPAIGEVPKSGAFGNASAISLTGNAKLCGGVSTLKLPTCPIKLSKQGKKNNFKMIIAIVSVAMSFLVLATFVIVYWRRKSTYSILESLPKVSYRRLYEATEGFSPSNLIGSGGFGSVYKGILNQGQSVAVKVLNLQQIGASKSFSTECNALRNIRHQNLIKILTCCSSTDSNQNEFIALVFEFMTNGSLEKWMHPDTEGENQPRNLSLIERLNVAKDVASALHYLHDQCETTILHCDIKPSNVLLDNEMVAHLGDFGLARLLLAADNSSQTQSWNDGNHQFSIQYGMGGQASKEGDVYSFGVLLLEMFTGKRTTDIIFVEGLNLHSFVANALPERLLQIADPNVVPSSSMTRDEEIRNNNGEISSENQSQMNGNYVQSCLLSVLRIAVGCSMESPEDRLKMEVVTRELHRIKKAFLVGLQLD
ncbi:hypothetical protein FNV43_RR05754 [Rhamnella rubrinervis]|uniref:non-specific serine/threonine protein kinase n=1 Tax=Rhamnella rubrinervis TaxID=2594499 RepID=A0A8K0HMN6_9ROSA|nr:hypothetical protein FNV43_RR05754 [Rhamnella rubrinervis]